MERASEVAGRAQPLDNPPREWYLKLLCCVYPLAGFILLGEGVVRLSLLMISRRRGEKEWPLVTASTYRNHIILCGVGRLGYRVLEQLRRAGTGMKGRQGVYEVMPMTPNLRKLVLQNVGAAEIRDAAVDEGMLTLRMDGWMKVMKGITTLEQVVRETSA